MLIDRLAINPLAPTIPHRSSGLVVAG